MHLPCDENGKSDASPEKSKMLTDEPMSGCPS
jgi:hypothetical protein